MLNNTSVWEEINRPQVNCDGVMRDFGDGLFVKEHPIFSKYPNALQVVLYYDDLEICNPLGSSAGKHKLGNQTYQF